MRLCWMLIGACAKVGCGMVTCGAIVCAVLGHLIQQRDIIRQCERGGCGEVERRAAVQYVCGGVE
jgi:hypothetical protein